MRTDICIVSGSHPLRYPSALNHALYAAQQEMDYRLECGPFGGLRRPHDLKLRAVQRVLARYEWVCWIDDDAFFTDFSRDILRRLITEAAPEVVFIVADGRPKPNSDFTVLNSGVWLLRNHPESFSFLERVLQHDLDIVRAWWRPELGMFTNTDQDAIVYDLLTNRLPVERWKIVPHAVLNARPYHWRTNRLDEWPVVHFAGVQQRAQAIHAFGERFPNVAPATLVPVSIGGSNTLGSGFLPPHGYTSLSLHLRDWVRRQVRQRLGTMNIAGIRI